MSVAALIAETAARHADNVTLPFSVRAMLTRMAETTDAAGAAAQLVDVIASTESMCEGMDGAAKDMRERLAMILQELPSKVLPIRGRHHDATVVTARDGVRITDPDAVPPAFMRQPAPAPDKAAILAALKAGQVVPGATLSNGGPSVLRITPRKGTT